MSKSSEVINLFIEVDLGPERDMVDLYETTNQLLSQLKDLNIETASTNTNSAVPPGAKSSEAITVGSLIVAVLPTVLPELISFFRNWITQSRGRAIKIKTQSGDHSVELEYDMSKISDEELDKLLKTLTKTIRDVSGEQ